MQLIGTCGNRVKLAIIYFYIIIENVGAPFQKFLETEVKMGQKLVAAFSDFRNLGTFMSMNGQDF